MDIIETYRSWQSACLKVALILMIGLSLGSCGSTKKLELDEKALIKNIYSINSNDKRVDKSKIKADLKGLIKQKPVKKIWLNPRTWGTPLTIYDEDLTNKSAAEFQQYLRNRKGFYHAEVSYTEEVRKQKVIVSYKVDLMDRYYIGDIKMQSQDTALYQLFSRYDDERHIDKGDPLDARIFDEEEARLVTIAKNNGYAGFNPNFVEFRGDSSSLDVATNIYIYNPINKEKHQRYSIGDINIYTEHLSSSDPSFIRTDTLGLNRYFAKSEDYIVQPETIEKILALRTGDVYSRKNQFLTNRTLSRLSPYRFIKLEPIVDPANDSLYNFNIFLSPNEHKWAFDMGGNLFYSLLNQAPSVTEQDLFGFGGNIGWTNRNFRNRAISHSFGIEGTFEFQIPSLNANTVGIQATNSFRVPHIVDVFKLAPFLNKVGLLTDKSYNNLNLYGGTDIDFSFGTTNILNNYSLNTVNASWAYNFQPDENNRYIWTQIGINVLDTRIDSMFQADILDPNPLLEKSFSDYLFTGFFFRELNIYKQSRETIGGSHFSFLGNIEISGLENLIINKGVNALTNYNDTWELAGLEFATFVRLESDIRYYKKVRERSTFAARFNMGIAIPYGGSDQVVPFVKSFFVGGPNSIRGWQLRELGPGAYSELLEAPVENQPFFQTGDFKIEMSMEYRFDLFWFWEGAVFADAGNVWTLKNDAERPGSQLSGSFLNEMAVGVGWGLRADFDYFLLRFDFGYKVRSPYLDPTNNSHIILNQNSLLENVNFAINYPF